MMGPKKVVYVSRDPATLARDVKYLEERGYWVERSKLCGYVPYEWARGNRHASRAETLILGGFAGLYEENEVVF